MQNKDFFGRHILSFFRNEGRRLPWRKARISAYEVWVSEIMLQQTQVGRVLEYYSKFLKRFPTVKHLARASWEEFLPYYAGLGYYNRGRNMLATARAIVGQWGGRFPRNQSDLLTLPGVGDYTARAILSFAYEQNTLAPDTNVRKVLGRFFYGSRRADLDVAVFNKQLHGKKKDFNAALMDFAGAVCKTRPLCEECSLKELCIYRKTGGKKEGKVKTKTRKLDTHSARVYLTLHKNHKEYYSESARGFESFILPEGVRSREEIKKYFRERYGLDLAVRPPHHMDTMRVLVNAQILLGHHNFEVYSKNDTFMAEQAGG